MKKSDKMSAEEKKDWEEKMSEPLKPIKITEEELNELKAKGIIN